MEKITIKDNAVMSPAMKDIYRRACTNIEFTGIENKAVCITSCAPNDGKSTISYGIARTFAESGKKVLLVDADMRKSVLGHQKGFREDLKGLSHFLSGKETLMSVLYSTNFENFHLLPTGVFPKNPVELLNKSRLGELISATKKAFDYIILDTPPLGSVVDAAVIARRCDGSILVISADKISRRSARNVKNQLVQANENVLGVILNNVNGRSGGYGYGKYGYKEYEYGYGYGYGY